MQKKKTSFCTFFFLSSPMMKQNQYTFPVHDTPILLVPRQNKNEKLSYNRRNANNKSPIFLLNKRKNIF